MATRMVQKVGLEVMPRVAMATVARPLVGAVMVPQLVAVVVRQAVQVAVVDRPAMARPVRVMPVMARSLQAVVAVTTASRPRLGRMGPRVVHRAPQVGVAGLATAATEAQPRVVRVALAELVRAAIAEMAVPVAWPVVEMAAPPRLAVNPWVVLRMVRPPISSLAVRVVPAAVGRVPLPEMPRVVVQRV